MTWKDKISDEICELCSTHMGECTKDCFVYDVMDIIRRELNDYSVWLEQCGYLDSDWWSEEPNAIDRYVGGDD